MKNIKTKSIIGGLHKKRRSADPLVNTFVDGLKDSAQRAISEGRYRVEAMFPEWATNAQVKSVSRALAAENYTVNTGWDSPREAWIHVGAPLDAASVARLAESVKARWQPVLFGMEGDNHRWLEIDPTMPREVIIEAVKLATLEGFALEEHRFEGDHWFEVWRDSESKKPRRKYGRRYHAPLLNKRIDSAISNAEHLRQCLATIRDIGPHGDWLGSRTLGPGTREYNWSAEAAKLFAMRGIGAKTGGGFGLMEAPHYGCYSAGRPHLSIAVRAAFLASEDEVNEFAKKGGVIFDMPDFNSRHDVLFLGSLFHVVLPGRLGTDHELKDLLNRLKHGLLDKAPVYFIERNGYWSNKVDFMTAAVSEELGPRTSPSDFAHAKIIDIFKTTPEEFVEMVLKDLERAQTKAFQSAQFDKNA